MNIVGLNAYHGDAAATILRDAQLVSAVEEERFARVKVPADARVWFAVVTQAAPFEKVMPATPFANPARREVTRPITRRVLASTRFRSSGLSPIVAEADSLRT